MKLYLKEAVFNDADLLFKWANDEVVRKNAFNSNIIAFSEHIDWMRQKLQLPNCKIYIGYVEDRPIGQIRIDIEDEIAIIDYSVDRLYRGNGYGKLLLEAIEGKIHSLKLHVEKIVGRVKYNNQSSLRTFKKAEYVRENKSEYILYTKKLRERNS